MTTTSANSLSTTQGGRPPLYRDAVVVKWVVQLAALALVIFALVFLGRQAQDNLVAKGISTSFDFLSEDPSISLSEGIDTEPNTGGRALWVGMVNTLRLAIAGIALATIVGVTVGLARLSENWIVRKVGSFFVELLRNIPLLVQILIYAALFASLGRVTESTGPINGWLHVSNKGVSIPRVFVADGFYQWAVVMLIGGLIARFVMKARQAQKDATGEDTFPLLYGLGVMVVAAIVGWFIHPIFGFLNGPLSAISDAIQKIPEILVQLGLSALAILLAVRWIQAFFAQRRTPGGSARLTDDDWFRVIFAGVGALLASVVFLVVWPGLSSWLINSSSDLFGVLSDKFGDGRSGVPIDAKRPDIVQSGNFPNYGRSGLNMSLGFAAVFFAIVMYTGAFIAEIVRGGILAVPKGQTEAANAVGLSRMQALRKVILPQAFRIILPPLGNQYLNLTKNTSLAIAVGFSDLVQVGQTVGNQTGKPLPVFGIWMLFYLACSLTISVVVNFFNVRLRIVER